MNEVLKVAEKKEALPNSARKLARLAAVQALYQNKYGQETLAQIISGNIAQNFAALREENEDDKNQPLIQGPVDKELFGDLVRGVVAHEAVLDEMIAGALDARFNSNRLELLLRCILRLGAFELHHHGHVASGVIINDYIDVTRAFFNAKEPGLVNAVLDKLAAKLRAKV